MGNPNNFLTLLGLVGVGLGFLFVSGQMAQTDKAIGLANDANEHTKRSVDAYVGAERGMMYYDGSVVNADETEVITRFRNIGRAPLFILRTEHEFLSSPVNETIPIVGWQTDPNERFNFPVLGGKEFVLGGKDSSLVNPDTKIPVHIREKILTGDNLYVQHRIIYDAFFAGRFAYCVYLMYERKDDGKRSAAILATFDIPIKRGDLDYRDGDVMGTPPRSTVWP